MPWQSGQRRRAKWARHKAAAPRWGPTTMQFTCCTAPRSLREAPRPCARKTSTRLKRRSRALRLSLLDFRLTRHRDNAQRRDAVALAAENAKAEAVEGETLAAFRNRARLVDHEPGDRGRLFIGKIPVHRAVEIADRLRAVHHDRAVRLRAHTSHDDVVLIGDIADDLLQDVLERDHAFDFAVFVDHKREMGLAAAKRLELFRYRAHLRDEPRRQGDRGDVDL